MEFNKQMKQLSKYIYRSQRGGYLLLFVEDPGSDPSIHKAAPNHL